MQCIRPNAHGPMHAQVFAIRAFSTPNSRLATTSSCSSSLDNQNPSILRIFSVEPYLIQRWKSSIQLSHKARPLKYVSWALRFDVKVEFEVAPVS